MSTNLIAAIIAFGIMIFAHELGHFLVAKRVGITVHAFAVGFGPKLVGVTRGETVYAINLVPFGGYVKLAGEELEDGGGPHTFRAKSVWQRMAVLAAGPLMNLLLALILLSGLALVLGVPSGVTNRIGQLLTDCVDNGHKVPCPAQQAGLQAGDTIVAINGRPMASGEEVIDTIHRNPHTRLRLVVERAGRRFEVEVTSILEARQNIGLIGYRPEAIRQHLGPIRALLWGISTIAQTTGALLTALAALITHPRQGMDSLMGPVGAVTFLGETARGGGEMFLYTAAAMSVLIGIFNLLPIPALDGGRLFFLAVEAVRRRPVDPRREGYIHMIGFALLILLLITLSVRDVARVCTWCSKLLNF